MDRKSIIVLSLSFLLLMAWYPLMERLGYIKRTVRPTNQLSQAQSPSHSSATNLNLRAGTPGTAPPSRTPELRSAPASSAAATLGAVTRAAEQVKEEILVIENADSRYEFTSFGGGIRQVELKLKRPSGAVAGRAHASDSGTTDSASLNTGAPAPALILLSPDPEFSGDYQFALSRLANGVRAEKTLTNGLRIIKDFTPGSNYMLSCTLRIENPTGNPIRVPSRDWIIGTATPLDQPDSALLTGVQWYNGSSAERVTDAWFANRTLGCIPGVPRESYLGGAGNVAWASVHNQFFTLIAIPSTNAPAVVAVKVALEAAASTNGVPAPARNGFQTGFRYPERVLPAGQSIEQRLELYSGPKKYSLLASLAASMKNNLDLVMEFDGFFGWFAKALLLSMNGLNALGLSYGIAIVAITVVIKLAFWPLTTASTRSMKRMAAFQPQMKALQEKYKDDSQKMNQKLMEFMKEHKISPLGGCLPLLLQIPVFFGFYKMLQSAIELRGAPFLWVADLSRSDTIGHIVGFPINPFPLLMGVTMLWQARLTPPSPGMDPVQQKIMKYMPLMFMVFLYNFSAGLTLYWTVQNLLSIAQMKLTKAEPAPSGHPPKPAVPPKAAAANKKKS